MLIKEYRIPLPLTVEEYRIAQLYMIAKKSRDESKGAGSGVEIIMNEPYEGGPGGKGGQYTRKIYHIGSHLPGWIKSLIPKSALTVEEEAWNAYPYTKTRYTSLFIEKFFIEIETYYYPDNGYQDNVFGLTGSDLNNRIVDIIDVVRDQMHGTDYIKEEDPKLYVSEKTGRGPLPENWLQQYWTECKGKQMPTSKGMSIMCAYKLCRVEFRYWGVQSKLEKFIDDVALRKTMLRAHKQAWVWQDEWYGLSMEDIRQIERETQEALKAKMGAEEVIHGETEDNIGESLDDRMKTSASESMFDSETGIKNPKVCQEEGTSELVDKSLETAYSFEISSLRNALERSLQPDCRRRKYSKPDSKEILYSPDGSRKRFESNADTWRMESLRRDSESGSEDEFFDCQDNNPNAESLIKWSSLDILSEDDADDSSPTTAERLKDSIFSQAFLQRVASEKGSRCFSAKIAEEAPCPSFPMSQPSCGIGILVLVLHAGSILDGSIDLATKKSDITTFRNSFEYVMRQHYPSMVGHIAIKLISCSGICTEALAILFSLSPYSFDVSPSFCEALQVTNESVPVGAIPLFACASAEYQDFVSKTIFSCNTSYQDFLKSEEGKGFNGRVVLMGDSMGSILAYDALCRSYSYSNRCDSENSVLNADVESDDLNEGNEFFFKHRRCSADSEQSTDCAKLDFEVADLFMFGSPLSLVLAYRKVLKGDKTTPILRPGTCQVFNLFHPTDPLAARLEPLISAKFSMIPPVNVARYQKYPLGDGQPYHLLELMQSHPQWFSEGSNVNALNLSSHSRRMSELSMQSTLSDFMDGLPLQNISSLIRKWWGKKRLDYALYCPEGLSNFPTNALPHLFHASYWESFDVIAFILRQISSVDFSAPTACEEKETPLFSPGQPREKWMKKRTSVKLKNLAANHRANDVIVKDGVAQILAARFMYGPLDMITLAGEKVDVHIMKDAGGEWIYLGTEVTDKAGKILYVIPKDKAVTYGIYPIKMVVRGDHTSANFHLVVVPPKTECVVFSIDGSFTASVSVTGRDPKVRAGAVDVVRHWQELGYFIIYITGRPDMQQQKVVSWLSQHNFPKGFTYFVDGLSRFPLIHKAEYLKSLVQDHDVVIHAAYGSSKDISVYTSIGLKPKQIFIVGKVSKKLYSQATVLTDGYASHLASLMAYGGSWPAQGNARMVIPRGHFGLPGQNASIRRRSGKSGIPSSVTADTTSVISAALGKKKTIVGSRQRTQTVSDALKSRPLDGSVTNPTLEETPFQKTLN